MAPRWLHVFLVGVKWLHVGSTLSPPFTQQERVRLKMLPGVAPEGQVAHLRFSFNWGWLQLGLSLASAWVQLGLSLASAWVQLGLSFPSAWASMELRTSAMLPRRTFFPIKKTWSQRGAILHQLEKRGANVEPFYTN